MMRITNNLLPSYIVARVGKYNSMRVLWHGNIHFQQQSFFGGII